MLQLLAAAPATINPNSLQQLAKVAGQLLVHACAVAHP
jgi:hypothetical protein